MALAPLTCSLAQTVSSPDLVPSLPPLKEPSTISAQVNPCLGASTVPRMILTRDTTIAVGVGLVLILLLGFSVLSYQNTVNLAERQSELARAHEQLGAIERLADLADRLSIQTQQAGQAAQQDEQVRESQRRMQESLDLLTQRRDQDPIQVEQLQTLRAMMQSRMARPVAPEASASESRSSSSRTSPPIVGIGGQDEMSTVLGVMRRNAEAAIRTQSRQAELAASLALVLVIGKALLILLLAGGGGLMILHTHVRRQAAEEEVREKQASQDLVLRSLPIAMYIAKPSEDFGALWVSENIEVLTGFSAQEFIGDSSLWSSRLHPLDQERAFREFMKLPQESTLSMEYRWQTRTGEYRWFRDEAMLIRRPDGVPQEIVGLWADVTARKQAESVIRHQADIIDQIEEAVITIDLDGRVTGWNKGAEKALGYTLAEALGKHISFIYPPQDRACLVQDIIERVKAAGAHQVEVRRQTKAGEVRFAQLSLTLLRDETHCPVGIIGFSMDITDRKLAREALVESRNRLEALAARLESVREEERTRIALEVHDVLGQALTALKLDLAWIAQQVADPTHQDRLGSVRTRLDSALGLIGATIGSVRELVTTLRPGVLDELGLAAAVEWLARDFQERTGIGCQVVIRPHRIGAGKDQSTALFRILQEILTNVARHAQATSVRIALEESDEELSLQVTDNGRGIGDDERSGRRGFGLLGMRLRARQQGGAFDIQGSGGSGTTVTVRIPLYGMGE